jgi:hypothetical protein
LSTLTKVFVVLLAVFSIAFTVMTVSVVAQTTNWRETAQTYEEQARIADTNLRSMIAASAADLAAARDQVQFHAANAADLEKKLADKTDESNQLRADLAKAEAGNASSTAMNASLVAQVKASESARDEYRKQREDLEKRNIELERRNVDLSDRVNELTARVAVMLEEKRQFEQQINILKTQNERLSRAGGAKPPVFESPSGAALPNVQAVNPPSGSPIRGSVVAVEDNLVTLSVGSADGVQQDMVFVLHRGGDYVGDVKVNVVNPDKCAGRLIRTARTPMAGDLATDSLSIAESGP